MSSVLDSGTFTNFEIGSTPSRDFVPLDVSIDLEAPAPGAFFVAHRRRQTNHAKADVLIQSAMTARCAR
jgi:hypothetical protein